MCVSRGSGSASFFFSQTCGLLGIDHGRRSVTGIGNHPGSQNTTFVKSYYSQKIDHTYYVNLWRITHT